MTAMRNEKDRLSACIVLYHSGETVMETLASLHAATTNVTVYVVDNTPEDDTATRISLRYPGVKIIRQKKNVGFGRANNAVLDQLESDYHLIINPDVTFEPDLLEKMIAYMDDENHKTVVAMTPRMKNSDGSEQPQPKLQPTMRYLLGGRLQKLGGRFARWRMEYTMENQTIRRPVRAYYAMGCFILVRTEIFKKLGGFDERFFLYHEDSDLSRRLANIGAIIYHPDMVIHHRWKRESAKSFRAFTLHLWSTIQFFAKWGFKW